MSVKKVILYALFLWMICTSAVIYGKQNLTKNCAPSSHTTLTQNAVANALGWVPAKTLRCGGYYIDTPIIYPKTILNSDKLFITSEQGLFSFRGTSISQGKITLTRSGQQIKANKAYLYRDPSTGKLKSIELIGNVQLKEPNQLVIGNYATYDLTTHAKTLKNILYRATISGDLTPKPLPVSYNEQQTSRKVSQLSAWGQANSFAQDEPNIYHFENGSYSTCPPTAQTWKVKTRTMELNKNTGRGHATHARLYLKSVPIFYTPYFNFPIDSRRQTGFLFPRFGILNQFGPWFRAPFYWNLAPNYDATITPGYLSKRGLQISNLFRYLTPTRSGDLTLAVLPNDKEFANFQRASQEIYQNTQSTTQQAELRELMNASTTRTAFSWVDNAHYNDNWSSSINYNYVSDDYYLKNFSSNLAEVTNNELLQEAQINYENPHWNFLTRFQSYQTLNQIDQSATPTVYSRFPQMVLVGSYPEQKFGLDYFINNDVTRFGIPNFPGNDTKLPIGVRTNIQPGISRPIMLPYLFIIPRLQFALTKYEIGLVNDTSKSPSRSIPIFDLNSGLFFDRDVTLFNKAFKQTLEPQVYYTYIPYKDQSNLPLFDTALNILTYDQLFTYNRFSGLDRIGDANQISLGITTRFIDSNVGYEKATAAIGEIYYFKKREVTLCSPQNLSACPALQNDPNNMSTRSPISALLKYNVNPEWGATANTIWNPKQTRVDNQNLTLQYHPGDRKIINLGYNFVRNMDEVLPWVPTSSSTSNLSQTDLSVSWPIARDWELLGRWTENWNQKHLQNILSGLQYDSCCWAVRFVAGRTFIGQGINNTYQYNNQVYVEFSLKGLGNYGPGGDASTLLASSIPGYQSNFGRNY